MGDHSKKYYNRDKDVPVRNRRIAISVSEEEYDLLHKKAKDRNVSLAKYVYMVTMRRELIVKTPQFLIDNRVMTGIANNLNQTLILLHKNGITGAGLKDMLGIMESLKQLIKSVQTWK